MASLHFRYSSMNAGKSTHLLAAAHNYRENGDSVVLFTSARDDRAGVGVIASRIGISSPALTFTPEDSFRQLLQDYVRSVKCVLIDEAQFLSPEQVKELHRWVHENGVPVMCFGLRSDFQGNPFPGSAMLLALADRLEEVKTVCKCGKRATMNLRLSRAGDPVFQGDQVEVGGNDRYSQACAYCFYAAAREALGSAYRLA